MTRPAARSTLVLTVVVLVALAATRPVNHDESQYVAAAALVARGLLPYRDFAYLQTPLQPLILAPVVALAGGLAWPALRLVNALFAAAALAFVYRAARAGGADERVALAATGLFAATDIFLFAAGTARNDALPAALLAAALAPIVRAANGEGTRAGAFLAMLLLCAAAAAKISYALPAAAYGVVALIDRRHRPAWLALGALPVVTLVATLAAIAPEGFRFGVFDFPAAAPTEYYLATGRGWKLGPAARVADVLRFLLTGPALLALIEALRVRWRGPRAIDAVLIAAAIAAVLPVPTFRQYLLPILPPLFVRLALVWSAHPPRRGVRVAAAAFAAVGLVPTLLGSADPRPAMLGAVRETAQVRAALAAAGVSGDVATTAPQLLPSGAIDPRFAAGPFYLRSAGLLDRAAERRLHVVSATRLDALGPVPAILTGAEAWSSGDPALDGALDRWAAARGYRREELPGGRLRLWIRPPGYASRPPAPGNRP